MEQAQRKAEITGRQAWLKTFSDTGEMGERIAAFGWSRTSLGPMEAWPQGLRALVSMIVANSFPMVLWAGPEYVQIYNDTYIPILGGNHPAGLGQTCQQCWPEVWPMVKPIFDTVYDSGKAVVIDDQHFPVTRNGYLEEVYCLTAYSPVRVEDGEIGHILVAMTETTGKVLGEMRLRTLRDLVARGPEARTPEEACRISAEVLEEGNADVPFALLYLGEEDGERAHLAASAGQDAGQRASPATVMLDGQDQGREAWPLSAGYHAGPQSISFEGSGIGLALVRELVRRHVGSIEVESAPGEGSTFIVRLPTGSAHLPAGKIGASRQLATTALGPNAYVEEVRRWLAEIDRNEVTGRTEDGEQAFLSVSPRPSTAGSDARMPERRPRILLADGNADTRAYIQRLLADPYEIIAVADGEAAWEAAQAQQPDLVLSDIMMPGLSGFALLQKLRGNRQTATTPVILLSARAGEESRVEGLEEGAYDYLVKPFSARELLARVHTHLQLTQLRREVEARKRQLEKALIRQGEEVRRRAGLELHDGVRQQLTGMSWLAISLHKTLAAKELPEAETLEDFSTLIREANVEVRRLINRLVAEQVGAAELQKALKGLATDTAGQYGVPCFAHYDEGLRLHEDELANSLYHPAREAVTNAAKHSGASHIELLKELWDHTLTLQVRDDGKGLLEEYDQMDGMGIQSMRQRAELMGAELRIERSASAGTVACALPQ